jgi:hypothetical protein
MFGDPPFHIREILDEDASTDNEDRAWLGLAADDGGGAFSERCLDLLRRAPRISRGRVVSGADNSFHGPGEPCGATANPHCDDRYCGESALCARLGSVEGRME